MIKPHGNKLVNLQISETEYKKLQKKKLRRIVIPDRNVSDCEMLGIGAFSPLTGFMKKSEAEKVINKMQLSNGLVWTIPIVLCVSEADFKNAKKGDELILTDQKGKEIALIKVSEKYHLDLKNYCKRIFKVDEMEHPGVAMTFALGNNFIAGNIKLIKKIHNKEIQEKYYLEPVDTRSMIEKKGWQTIVAFQTRNPIHRAHEYIIKCALENHDGLLIHPLVGETKSDDVPADTRMKCYELLLEKYFNKNKSILSVMPAAMRYAGPKEAIHHLIIRQNYGCTHMIIGRDHAGVGNYYGTYEAQELARKLSSKLLITPIYFENAFFCSECSYVVTAKTCPHDESKHLVLSGTKVREMLRNGIRPPLEFSRKEIADILIKWATNK